MAFYVPPRYYRSLKGASEISKQGNIIRLVVFVLLTLATIWRMEWKVVRLEHNIMVYRKEKQETGWCKGIRLNDARGGRWSEDQGDCSS